MAHSHRILVNTLYGAARDRCCLQEVSRFACTSRRAVPGSSNHVVLRNYVWLCDYISGLVWDGVRHAPLPAVRAHVTERPMSAKDVLS